MRYSDEIIDEVRQTNDIVDIISQYVHLKRSGRNFFGLCPFHNEKSPSFSVSPDKHIFHCFGCGVGGNVFTFLTKIEGISFVEAVQMLAERSNIQLPTLQNSADSFKVLIVMICPRNHGHVDFQLMQYNGCFSVSHRRHPFCFNYRRCRKTAAEGA